jgi:hypothetical protein
VLAGGVGRELVCPVMKDLSDEHFDLVNRLHG